MKGLKESLILLVLIMAIGAYLWFKSTDQINYKMPNQETLDAKKITQIEVSNDGQTVCIKRKDNAWYIDPKGYLADSVKVDKMLTTVREFNLTNMVSESENYARYELDDKNKITVRAYAGPILTRQFDIGKTAPSCRYTYVMLPKDTKVYMASNDFRGDFKQTAASLRDKKVLSFNQDEINKVSIVKGGKPLILTKQESQAEPAKPGDKDPVRKIKWTDNTGREIANPDVDAMFSSLNALECDEYLDLSKETLGSPEITVALTGMKEYTLSLYPKQETKIPATSSENTSVFTLQDYLQENIQKSIEKLMKRT